jgi:hypothetical protein
MMNEAQFHGAIGDWTSQYPVPRMRIYRNNVVGALTAALEVRYPVTAQLVGAEFFLGMAAQFAGGHRPESPVLLDYGKDFPDFIRTYEPARGVSYLSDIARFESLWWQCYHAAEAAPLHAAAIARVSPDRWGFLHFDLHPSVQLMESPYAVSSIWQAHRGGPALGTFAVDIHEQVLISRPHADVSVFQISAGQFAFLDALKSGQSLAASIEAGLERDSGFDIGGQISGLFGLGLVSGFHS